MRTARINDRHHVLQLGSNVIDDLVIAEVFSTYIILIIYCMNFESALNEECTCCYALPDLYHCRPHLQPELVKCRIVLPGY